MLDPARERLGKPIMVNSGYRCPLKNKAVGGVPNSQHLKGEAADITCAEMTIPDAPNSKLQKYILTDAGRELGKIKH